MPESKFLLSIYNLRLILSRVSPMTALLLGAAVLGHGCCGQCADVVVDRYQTFQTIAGWGDGGGFYSSITGIAGNMLDPAVVNSINYRYFDYLADDLGLTGTRTWEVGPRIDGTGMDHGDLLSTNWTSLTDGIPGNSTSQTVLDIATNLPARLYRLRVSGP